MRRRGVECALMVRRRANRHWGSCKLARVSVFNFALLGFWTKFWISFSYFFKIKTNISLEVMQFIDVCKTLPRTSAHITSFPFAVRSHDPKLLPSHLYLLFAHSSLHRVKLSLIQSPSFITLTESTRLLPISRNDGIKFTTPHLVRARENRRR